MQEHRRPGRHRPRPLRHLRRRRPQLRPAVRARPRPQGQVVRLRLQRPARQLSASSSDELLDQGRLPPEARHRHRNHHALAQPTSSRPRTSEPDWVEVFGRLAEQFDGAYNIVLSRPSATWSWPATRWASGRSASPRTARCSPRPARACRWPTSASGTSARWSRGRWPSPTATASGSSGSPPRRSQAHCFFEWIYFANVASTLDDRSVYLSRAALGKELARLEDVPLDADTIVVPVPDTAKAAADAMAFALGVPSVEGLMRNRYVGRTFIEGTADRAAKARLKYTPLPEVLAGKRVLLVEDSIVRSTTMRALRARDPRPRRRAGDPPPRRLPADHRPVLLRHRHVAAATSCSPPSSSTCPTAASPTTAQQRMAKELGADSLRYLPVEAIARSVGLSSDRLCRACITGHYPTPTGQQLYQIDAIKSSQSNGNGAGTHAPTRSPRRPPRRLVPELMSTTAGNLLPLGQSCSEEYARDRSRSTPHERPREERAGTCPGDIRPAAEWGVYAALFRYRRRMVSARLARSSSWCWQRTTLPRTVPSSPEAQP